MRRIRAKGATSDAEGGAPALIGWGVVTLNSAALQILQVLSAIAIVGEVGTLTQVRVRDEEDAS
jgi:hypothetical protein